MEGNQQTNWLPNEGPKGDVDYLVEDLPCLDLASLIFAEVLDEC